MTRSAITVWGAWRRLGIGVVAGIGLTVGLAWLDALVGVPVLTVQTVFVRQAPGAFAVHATDSLPDAQEAVANLDGRTDGDWSGWVFFGGPPGSVIQQDDRKGVGFTRYRLRGWPLRALYCSARSPWRAEWTRGWAAPAANASEANAQLQPAALPGMGSDTIYRWYPSQGRQWDEVLGAMSARIRDGADGWVMEGGIAWRSGDPLARALPLRIFPLGFGFDCAFWAGVVILGLHVWDRRRGWAAGRS